MTFRKSSYFHGLNVSDDTYSGSFEGEYTGSTSASVTGAVAVLSSPWARSTGSDAGGAFDANDFTLAEFGSRFGALVDELLVFIPLPPAPLTLPQTESLTLHYDAREQGDISIIQEIINAQNAAASSGTFTFRQDPPSVDLFSGLTATDNSVNHALVFDTPDAIQTMMVLAKPENIGTQTVIDFGGRNRLLVSSGDWKFDAFETSGDDPPTNTEIPVTQSVWQTICYVIDVDGANKQNGYHNGALSIGPLNKSFDVAQFSLAMTIGLSSGSFGAYLQWTTPLTAAEVAQAHNFLRAIDAGYGLPEAL